MIRLPRTWNGGLVVAGSPGVRAQYANDKAISDYVLSLGYAFAATDKGNTGAASTPTVCVPATRSSSGTSVRRNCPSRSRHGVAQYYGRPAREVIAAGISNGGYLVRWQLENHPELFTRGVDLEGTLWTADGPNLFTYLPQAIKGYEQHDPAAIVAAGFDPRSDFLWDYHYTVYWKLTQRIYAAELDPTYTGSEADYDYTQRPEAHRAIKRIALTGKIKKPLITIHGTYDSLLPITQDSDVYAEMVRERTRPAHVPAGRGRQPRRRPRRHLPRPAGTARPPAAAGNQNTIVRRSAKSSCSSISRPRLVNHVAMLWQSRSRKSIPFGLPTMSTTCGRSIITIRSPWASTLYGERSPCASPARASSRIPPRSCSKY